MKHLALAVTVVLVTAAHTPVFAQSSIGTARPNNSRAAQSSKPAALAPADKWMGQTVSAADADAWSAIADAEDARAAAPEQLATLIGGTHDTSVEIRRISVRALGRLQRADLADTIASALHDPAPVVRAEAAHALALATIADRAPNAVRATVRAALQTERNSAVIGALAETLGRLRNANADSARIVARELGALIDGDSAQRLGAVRGLHFIVRQPATIRAGIDAARDELTRVATSGASATKSMSATSGTNPARGANSARGAPPTNAALAPNDASAAQHARRLATETLALAGLGSEAIALQILHDPDPIVRREAVLMAAPPMRDTAVAHHIIDAALHDPFWLVRFEAMRQYGSRIAAAQPCTTLLPYTRDASMHVRLEAIDIMADRCVADATTARTLDSIASTLPPSSIGEWHPAAHALVSLAARDRERARTLLPRFVSHPNLFVRTYAANAATTIADTATLKRLAFDAHPNVRAAAVHGLHQLQHHTADAIYLGELDLDDSQLLMETAAALDSTRTDGAAARMLDALDRVTRAKRENSRDGRLALLKSIADTYDTATVPRLTPYLRDFDPQVATRAAAIIKAWTGAVASPAPQLLPREPIPSFAEMTALSKARFHVEMENGATFDVRVLPFEAPTNAARFARLARAGYFDGLTLHRVEPNFVVQGGSPNANEYTGAPRFSRDEIGFPNDRGTIGLSARGHDTGDAQFYINTIDNTQLDPLYTVFAVVTSGMPNADAILEGAAIRHITVR